MAGSRDRRFDELYDRHFRDVLAYCLRRGEVDDAYDAANEVFAIAWRRIDDVPLGEAARPWLFVVAKRVLYRRRRGSKRFRRLVEKAGSVRATGGPDPATVVVRRAEYDAVVEAASYLSARDREVRLEERPQLADPDDRRVVAEIAYHLLQFMVQQSLSIKNRYRYEMVCPVAV